VRPLLLLALLAVPAVAYNDYDDPPPIQRYLAELELGDSLKDVQRIYAPAHPWSSHIEPRGRVTRYRVERSAAKSFPLWAQELVLGFKRGRLVDIQVIYDAERSRKKTFEDLARDISLTYGEGERSGNKFWWVDGNTVMRVFPVEVPTLKDGVSGAEWRTSFQILEKDLYKRVD
jgi:hypothetical protein